MSLPKDTGKCGVKKLPKFRNGGRWGGGREEREREREREGEGVRERWGKKGGEGDTKQRERDVYSARIEMAIV